MDEIADRIEHTVLGPRTSWGAVTSVLDEAIRLGMRACVPPWSVERSTNYAPGVAVTTVIAFPHGQAATETKVSAARTAFDDGASEIDVVANLGYLEGNQAGLEADIAEVVSAVPIPVKVIVEAPLLNNAELNRIGSVVASADAAFLKTATGFGDGGATVADVECLSQYRPVKASGGIDSWSAAKSLFEAGAGRIGTSNGATIVEEFRRGT